MIINVCGPSGAGKSHLVREFMKKFTDVEPVFFEGRKQPHHYLIKTSVGRLCIVGHYEAPTGGCDTLKDTPSVFQFIAEQASKGDVLYEGLYMMNMERGPSLVKAHALHVLALSTSLGTCAESVAARRDPDRIYSRDPRSAVQANWGRAESYVRKMKMAGAFVHAVSREQAAVKLGEMFCG